MEQNYEKIIEFVTEKILESIKSVSPVTINWEYVKNIDYSFGGSLKVFTRPLGLKNMDIIIGEFKKGEGLKKHCHKYPTEEIYYILEGEVEVNMSNKKVFLKKGNMLSIPPEVIHWPVNHGTEICRVLFILAPPETEPPVIFE